MNYIKQYGNDILNSSNMNLSKTFIQHGTTSVYTHSLDVCKMSLKIATKLNIKVDYKSLVRGSLLHDYFLYDWHIKDKSHRLHGFRHARFAYLNAIKEYELNKIEKNMILSHMFPLNLRIPRYKESIILCIADKICAFKETSFILLYKFKYIFKQIFYNACFLFLYLIYYK